MADVKLTHVAKTYGGTVEVLKDINLDIKKGELIVFVGPSGCGKSTLLRMIAGLEKITGGELQIDGQVVNDVPPAQRGIAMVFQSYALYPHMTVRDNMSFALKLAKKTPAEIDVAVSNAAKILQLDDYLDRLPKALSGGQRQRVAIGRSIVRDPKVYLFDEPLSNLDAKLRVSTRAQIKNLSHELKTTTIYVTHDQSEALVMSDEIIVMSKGKIEQRGGPVEIYSRPVNEYVSNFIGVANLLKAKVRDTNGSGQGVVEVLQDGQTMTVPCQIGPGIGAGDDAVLSVRPENVHAVRESDGGDDVEGEVTHAIFLGNYVDCRVKWGEFEWKVIAHPRTRLKAGEKVFLKFDPEHTLAVQP